MRQNDEDILRMQRLKLGAQRPKHRNNVELRTTRKIRQRVTDLRVISGKYRGLKLKTPLNAATHPMGARERLAIFNMVAVAGEKVLDAYAGTGVLGIEALSRGASEVIFIEANRAVGKILQENLAMTKVNRTKEEVFQKKPTMEGVDSAVYIEKVGNFAENGDFARYFGVILADPPYDNIDVAELNKLGGLLGSGGVLALSSPAEMEAIELAGLRISSTHTYARARVTVYRKY